MKKLSILVLMLCIITSAGFAQGSFTDFKVGVLIPSDAQTGFLGGIGFGRMVDENIGAGLEIGYYGKTYTKETTVSNDPQGQVQTNVIQTEIENSTTLIPVLFHLVFVTKAGPNFDLRFTGGVGYEFMWNSETNYNEGIDETRFYSGFAWQVGVGASMPISRNADLFVETLYHSGSPSRDEGETAYGLPIRSEVDMSGMVFRAGVRLLNFGF